MTSPTVSFTGSSGQRAPLGDLMQRHASLDPDAPALTVDDRSVSRAEFEARCNRRARFLAGLGVTQDDLVTVALPNGLEFFETVFALWKLGATPNPVSSALSDPELSGILEVGRPRLVIGIDPGRAAGFNTLESGTEIPADMSPDYEPSLVPRYWKAMTSGGSTGRPKLIVDHMAGTWDPAEGGLAQRPGETILNPGPLYHNGPFLASMLGLFSGGHVVEMGHFDPVGVLEQIARRQITWTLLVPTMMHRITRLPDAVREAFDLSSLRRVVHSAAPCPVWLKRFWIDWLGPDRILEVYTGTERQAVVTISGEDWLAHPGSVGRAPEGSGIRILDDEGRDLPPGEIGEIFLRPDAGRNATYHYLGAEARARGEWESLGDLGWTDADGYLFLSDRRKDLIIRGGANIYPAEVEAALDSHPAVMSSAVIGLPDEDFGEVIHALVQLSPSATASAAELRAYLKTQLTYYKVPKTIEFVAEPLRDAAGKVRRSQLRDDRLARVSTGPAGAVTPR